MTKAIIKNGRFKYGITLCSLIVTFLMLIKIEGVDALDAVRVLFGGYPLRRMILILAFVMSIALLQYLNLDSIMCFLRKNTCFLIRYKKRKTLIYKLLKYIFLINIVFIGLIVIAFGISAVVCGLDIFGIDVFQALELGFRGYIMCICCSLIQVISMIKTDEANTFMTMIAISVLGVFLSRIKIGIFTIFPSKMIINEMYINLLICSLYIIAEIYFCIMMFQKKES
ncbi:MAG: hypothetical protein K2N51_13235 [Lachnospiraceae bacterium]|nr:hypothetical protein [Lachnospiraceae bacterium]